MNEEPEANAVLGKSTQREDIFYYTLEVKDIEGITPKLKQVIADMAKLKKEHDDLVNQLVVRTPRPAGWGVKLHKVYDYGYVEVMVTRIVYKENKPVPHQLPITPKPTEETKLQKLLRNIDAKTLFNSGILTKEEKRELLGL